MKRSLFLLLYYYLLCCLTAVLGFHRHYIESAVEVYCGVGSSDVMSAGDKLTVEAVYI